MPDAASNGSVPVGSKIQYLTFLTLYSPPLAYKSQTPTRNVRGMSMMSVDITDPPTGYEGISFILRYRPVPYRTIAFVLPAVMVVVFGA
jgi:hypothetical protein